MENRLYLDTNVVIDLLDPAARERLGGGFYSYQQFHNHIVFISCLSVHIYMYITRSKVPSAKSSDLTMMFNLIALTKDITLRSLGGPTNDFEDNIQLHSAIAAGADMFITRDKQLLSMGYFGACQISNSP